MRGQGQVTTFSAQFLLLLLLWAPPPIYIPALASSSSQHFSRNTQFLIPFSSFVRCLQRWRLTEGQETLKEDIFFWTVGQEQRPVSSSIIPVEDNYWLHDFWRGYLRQHRGVSARGRQSPAPTEAVLNTSWNRLLKASGKHHDQNHGHCELWAGNSHCTASIKALVFHLHVLRHWGAVL